MSLTRVQFTIGTVQISTSPSFFIRLKWPVKFDLEIARPWHELDLIWTTKRGEGEEEHDTVEGDAHTIISCIIFSMSCVLFLIVIVFVYDVVKYTKFGRNYLTVSKILRLFEVMNWSSALESQDCKMKSRNTVGHFQSLPYHSQQEVNWGRICLSETPWSPFKTKKCAKQRNQR